MHRRTVSSDHHYHLYHAYKFHFDFRRVHSILWFSCFFSPVHYHLLVANQCTNTSTFMKEKDWTKQSAWFLLSIIIFSRKNGREKSWKKNEKRILWNLSCACRHIRRSTRQAGQATRIDMLLLYNSNNNRTFWCECNAHLCVRVCAFGMVEVRCAFFPTSFCSKSVNMERETNFPTFFISLVFSSLLLGIHQRKLLLFNVTKTKQSKTVTNTSFCCAEDQQQRFFVRTIKEHIEADKRWDQNTEHTKERKNKCSHTHIHHISSISDPKKRRLSTEQNRTPKQKGTAESAIFIIVIDVTPFSLLNIDIYLCIWKGAHTQSSHIPVSTSCHGMAFYASLLPLSMPFSLHFKTIFCMRLIFLVSRAEVHTSPCIRAWS